jgi:hypothetical protein
MEQEHHRYLISPEYSAQQLSAVKKMQLCKSQIYIANFDSSIRVSTKTGRYLTRK